MSKNRWNYFITGGIILFLGTTIIIGSLNLYTSIIQLLVFVFLLHGISNLCSLILKKEVSIELFIRTILTVLFAVIMNIFPNIPLSIVPILFAIYLLFNSAVKGISAYYLWKNAQKKWKELFLFLFFLVAGVTFLFAPIGHLPTFLSIMGIYCILIGLGKWKDLLLEYIPIHFSKRTFRISLPTFLDAFIPRQMLTKINRYFNNNKEEPKISQIQKENVTPDLEIFIHVAPQGFNQLGHMDIYFGGKVISYGNYDPASSQLLDSIGDGVLFETDKERYIPFCIKQSNKTLIGFGLKLTDAQKKKVQEEIDKIKKNAYIWNPPVIQDSMKKEKKSYIELLYLETNATLYKFKTGEFKTYFVLGRNCTLFADRIVGKSGTDILKIAGIITPGAYLDYLEDEFAKRNSKVICRTIYNEATKEEHFTIV